MPCYRGFTKLSKGRGGEGEGGGERERAKGFKNALSDLFNYEIIFLQLISNWIYSLSLAKGAGTG